MSLIVGLQDDHIVCYLPMAWVGDFMISVGQVMVAGACLNCPEGADTVQMDVKEMGPTVFFGPPPLWERLKTEVNIRIEDASSFKKGSISLFHEPCGKGREEDIRESKRWIYR